MLPPKAAAANLQHPADVVRTVNFVTQALTLAFCSTFVGIRAYVRLNTVGRDLNIDDCKFWWTGQGDRKHGRSSSCLLRHHSS